MTAPQINSYIQQTGTAQSLAGMPKPISQPIRSDGTFSQDTWRYLNSFSSAPGQEVLITLGASPAVFKAVSNGSVFVAGGTVSSVALTRNQSYTMPNTSGMFPMSIGDFLTVTYTVAPTLIWFPR